MHRDNPVSRWLVGLTAGLLLLPVLGQLCFHPAMGLPAFFGPNARGPMWAGIAGAVLIGLSVLALVRFARFVLATALLCGAMIVQYVAASGDIRDSRVPMSLSLLESSGVPGVEVFCNGVSLGKLPVSLWEADFREKVPQWQNPPDQPLTRISLDANRKPLFSYGPDWYWTPLDPFEAWRQWPPDHFSWSHESNEKFMAGMARYRYWWHFEHDGYAAVRAVGGLGGGGGGGLIVQSMTTHVSDLRFPAVPRVIELLLESLRDTDYQPSPEWIAYVGRHRQLLFRELHLAANDDRRLEPVLDAVMRGVYQLPLEPTADDAKRVLHRILADVKQAATFTKPSVEAHALATIAPLAAADVYAEFRKVYPQLLKPGASGKSSSDAWETRYGTAQAMPGEVLLEALGLIDPDPVFDELVTLCARRGQGSPGGMQVLSILVRSRRPEARAVVAPLGIQTDLRVLPQRQLTDATLIALLTGFTRIESQGFHESLRAYLVRQLPVSIGESSVFQAFQQYVEQRTRLEASTASLASWIRTAPFLSPYQKALLLLRTSTPELRDWLAELEPEIELSKCDDLLTWLVNHPRPEADLLVLRTIARMRAAYPNTTYAVWQKAVLRLDSPAIRDYLLLQATTEPGRWSEHFANPGEDPLPHLDWLVPTLAVETNDFKKRSAVDLLIAIGTPAAEALLARWNSDPDRSISEFVAARLVIREERQQKRQHKREQLADLLAGRITPQDLLPRSDYVWRDGVYVPGPRSE